MKHLIEQLESFTEDKLGSGERYKKLIKDLESKGVDDPKALAAWIGRKKYGKKKFQALAKKGQKRAMGEEALSEEFGGLRGVRNWDWHNLPKNEVGPDEDKRFLTVASLLLLKTKTPGVVTLLEKPYGKTRWNGRGWGDLRDIEKRVKKALESRIKQEAVMVRDTFHGMIADGFMEDDQLRGAMNEIHKALESVRREIKGVRVAEREVPDWKRYELTDRTLETAYVVSAPRLNAQAAKYQDRRAEIHNDAMEEMLGPR